MKNNFASRIISIMLLAVILAGIFIPANFCITAEATSNDTESVIDGILKWKHNGSAQNLADEISDSMGSSISDWYAISLSRYKYNINFSKCVKSLDKYTNSAENLRATDMQRIAITYTAMGSKSDYIKTALNGSIGKLGIMSYAYGLIMLDCGAYYGSMTRDEIINKILSMQFSDGGWGLMQNSDVDVTAMTIQALARYYKHSDVKTAIDKALNYLSKRQQSDGDFKSYGTSNAESTAQVLLALSTMKINCNTDSRFIKNGNTVYDGLLKYHNSDGSFSHTYGGDSNQLATVQALYATISLWRLENGKTAFFEFVSNNIQREISTKPEPKPNKDNSKPSSSSSVSSKPNNSSNSSTSSYSQTSQISKPSQNSHTNSSISSKIENSKAELSTNNKQNVENSVTSKSKSSETTTLESSKAESIKNSNMEEISEHNKKSSNLSKSESSDIAETQAVNYNLIIALCLLGIFVIIFVVLIIRKKLNKTNIIVLVALFAVLTGISLTIKIETPNQYYNETSDNKQNTKTVTISISCKNAIGKTDNKKIPENGIILDDTEFSISEGDTVFDVLVSATKKNKIQIDYDSSNETVYVKGINGLYEFDCGELSGWMYKVNGETPNVGCSGYKLKDGDVIEWAYTANIGKDL
ncbi:DUF4430 domain-containing protein [Candidatus Pseudoruminococcus sp.]|uniref:DUF4430 domain-containing protein n=1 Tax=Candidatus Pseudoruminococcus sp. TaxID=3101048 RepID=UPI0039999124